MSDNKAVQTSSEFKDLVRHYLNYSVGRTWDDASKHDLFNAVALAVRERLIDIMIDTEKRYQEQGAKRLYYLSMEFLMGRALGNNLHNLEIFEASKDALMEMVKI